MSATSFVTTVRPFALWLIASLTFLCVVAPALAVSTHEIRIVRHAETAPLHFADWLVTDGTPYTVQILAPPAYGQLVGETYHPQDEFWAIGADLVGLEIQPDGGAPFRCNLLLVVRDNQTQILIDESFDDGWPAGWEVDGNPNLIQWVADSGAGPALQAFLPTSTESVLTGPPSSGSSLSNGYHAQGGAGSIILDPPKFDDNGHVAFFTAQPDAGATANPLYLQVRHRDSGYAVRASSGCNHCTTMPTPWRDVPINVPFRFEVWSGPVVYRIDPDLGFQPLHRAARLTLDVPGAETTVDWLVGEYDLDPFQVGLFAPQGLSMVSLSVPDLELWEEIDGGLPTLLVADGFEDGGFGSGWSTYGPVGVSSQAALRGDWGAEVDVDTLRQSGQPAGLLVDDLVEPASRIGALAEVDFASLALQHGERLDLVTFTNVQEWRTGTALRLLVRSSNGTYQLRLRVRDGNGLWNMTPWVPITAARHTLGVSWRAGAGTGAATLWVDGEPVVGVEGLNNASDRVGALGLGVLSSTLDGPTGQPSALRFDDIVIFR